VPKLNALVLLVFWLSIVTSLSLVKFGKLPVVPVENSDKLVHFVFYFITALLCFWVLRTFAVSFLLSLLISLVFSVGYGILIEIMQDNFTETRRFEWNDIFANTFGALVALFGVLLLRNKVKFFK
jgi:VanZ family protein